MGAARDVIIDVTNFEWQPIFNISNTIMVVEVSGLKGWISNIAFSCNNDAVTNPLANP